MKRCYIQKQTHLLKYVLYFYMEAKYNILLEVLMTSTNVTEQIQHLVGCVIELDGGGGRRAAEESAANGCGQCQPGGLLFRILKSEMDKLFDMAG